MKLVFRHIELFLVLGPIESKMNNHDQIRMKLNYFIQTKKIPNIIFHGPSHAGKRTLLNEFLQNIYANDPHKMKSQIMTVECCHGKGIKFIREDLKFFAKTHIQSNHGTNFKSIVLLNADYLTIDAQSALRRCIELFSHNTRFFIIVENKERLLNPILSRFCEIYVSPHLHADSSVVKTVEDLEGNQLYQEICKKVLESESRNLIHLAISWYNHGYSTKDWMNYCTVDNNIDPSKLILMNMCFYKIKPDYRCEQMLIYYIMYFHFVCSNEDLENMLL